MQGTIQKGYEGGIEVGQRVIYVLTGTGPTSYSQTTGDVITPPSGFYIDYAAASSTVSKTYSLRAIPSAGGSRATWQFKWYVISTGAEVANAVNLSAETVQFVLLGGAF
jgi:hypothetical protein